MNSIKSNIVCDFTSQTYFNNITNLRYIFSKYLKKKHVFYKLGKKEFFFFKSCEIDGIRIYVCDGKSVCKE